MALRGTNQEFGRPFNRRIVLETIRTEGPITRAEIAKKVGLTVQTVSTITGELQRDGLVIPRRVVPKGRGYPAPALEINPSGGHAVGVHLTPLGVQVALVNMAGEIVAEDEHAAARLGPDEAIAEIARLVAGLTGRIDGRPLGVGVAMPGPFDVDSMSFVGPTTLEGWSGVPVAERLRERLGMPVFVEVDTAAAAVGELMYGLGGRHRTFYYLYFGVGLGGRMIENGAIHRGAWGNSGEIGHLPLVPGGEPCPCGNRGCLERYVSLDAFERRGRSRGVDAWASETAEFLRAAVVTIENLYDPETIVIGGMAPSALLAALMSGLGDLPNSVAARRSRSTPRIVLSSGGPEAVLRGAAAMAVSEALSPRIDLLFPPRDGARPQGRAAAAQIRSAMG